jgi:DNA-binding CsgD family transcriptional regulator
MALQDALQTARDAYQRQAWAEARAAYATARGNASFTLDDIERYAIAAHLIGDEDASRNIFTEGYRESLARDAVTRAARFAFWLGHSLIFAGELGQAGGWWARARGLLSEQGADCVEWGYLLVGTGVEQIGTGDYLAARDTFTEAQAIGRRFADPDLPAMAGHGRGRALIGLGLTGEAMRVLDEVMVAVTAGEVSPLIVGDVYCGVLEACHDVFDVGRAREWTAALARWCEGQPDLVPYRGPCLVHRVEVMRLRGDWEDALEEARRACDWLSMPTSPEGPGDAYYQLGELYRLRGDFVAANDAYREASRLGREPEPGLGLLWLASGRAEAARASVGRALDETADADRARRAELLAAYVEILLATGELREARGAATQLQELASRFEALPLQALAQRAEGAVLLAEGKPRLALTALRNAWTAWSRLDAPYEGARVRALIGAACRALGDDESAAMEDDAARWVFQQLGAARDLAQLEGSPARSAQPPAGLTPRELEVLALVAEGETNKAVAAALVISEHTVARHVQNMLVKLGFSSRTGLATFAVEQGLTRPRHPDSQK